VFKNKVFVIYLFLIFTSFALLDYSIILNIKKENISHNKKIAEIYVNTIESLIDREKYSQKLIQTLSKEYLSKFGARITFIDSKGKVLADSQIPQKKIEYVENHIRRPEVKNAIEYGEGFSLRHSKTIGKDLLYYSRIKKINGENLIIRASLPLKDINAEIYAARKKISTYFLFFLFISVTAGWAIFKKAFSPLGKIIYASKLYASGDFSHRIKIEGKGELKKLSETLNYMAENLERQLFELKLTNSQLSMIFENIKESLALIDSRGFIEKFNKQFSDTFKLNSQDIKISDILKSGDAIDAVISAIKEKKRVDKNFVYIDNGKNYEISIIPITMINDTYKYLLVVYDVDEDKKLETIKKDFIANLSHEIKTPLTAIKTSLETIMSDKNITKEDLSIFLLAIDKNVSRIESISRDIISLNYLESDMLKIKKEKINLFSYTSSISESFRASLISSEINFSNEIDKSLFIESDMDILEKAFFNLFDNAIKFNMKGGFIRTRNLKEENTLKIFFENSGPEIPEESLSRIFERFYTVNKSRSRLKGGTGLGLSIVKHAVEILGGTVRAESSDGVNSFIISFPQSPRGT